MKKYVAKKPDAQGIVNFTDEENETWNILINRQLRIVRDRACDDFIRGLKKLDMSHDRIPQCYEISEKLQAATGWSVVPVDAIIPLETFFSLLANKQFPAATFIRTREDLDYLQEPDIFHEFFGHCPMLTNQAYADFVQRYGENALKTKDKKIQSQLGRLFWFTIEFGLIRQKEGLRIYGGGILSSYQEAQYALESPDPTREPFNVGTILKSPYRYDEIQKKYFIIDQLSDLFDLKFSEITALIEQIAVSEQEKNFKIC